MSVDYSSIAMNSALLATILTPVLGYLHKESQTYFLDLLAIPFVLLMLAVVTSTLIPDIWSAVLFVVGVIFEILIYLMITLEEYYFQKLKLT